MPTNTAKRSPMMGIIYLARLNAFMRRDYRCVASTMRDSCLSSEIKYPLAHLGIIVLIQCPPMIRQDSFQLKDTRPFEGGSKWLPWRSQNIPISHLLVPRIFDEKTFIISN